MLQNQIYNSRIQNLPEKGDSVDPLEESHLTDKTVFVSTKKGVVTKKAGENATGEVYEVEFEDGETGVYGASELEMAIEDFNDEIKNKKNETFTEAELAHFESVINRKE